MNIFKKRENCALLGLSALLVFSVSITIVTGQTPGPNVTTDSVNIDGDWWEWWGAKNESDFGNLCETDNDKIGQKLGCSCMTDRNADGSFEANCSDKWLGYNDTLILPPYVNISSHVRSVDFSKNYLTKINEKTFGNCEGVFKLTFHKNSIQSVHNFNCSQLKNLDLSWNDIRNLTSDSFKHLSLLTHLDLSYNNLVFLDHDVFSQLHQLQSLNLAGNPIGDELFYARDYFLSLKNLQYLEHLDLGNTSIYDLPFSLIEGTKNLKRLRLNNNRITYIPGKAFEEMLNLEELDLSGNLFETIPSYSFIDLKNLQRLKIDKMDLLTKIEPYAFTGLTSLIELSCSWNHFLTHIDENAFRNDSLGGECNPKIVLLNDNDLSYIDFPLLEWKFLEELELFRNPWVCDCNLQWVSEFSRKRRQDAAILIDRDFQCYEPSPLKTMPVTSVEPELMMCYSPAAAVAGTIGIIVFCVVLIAFVVVVALGRLGILPQKLQRINVFGNGNILPKYTRVHPKPSRSRRMEKMSSVNYNDRNIFDPAPDLEWDNGDIETR